MDDLKFEQWKSEQEAKAAQWRAEWEAKLAKFHVDHAWKLAWDTEMFKSVISAGQAALKCSLLVNGGAAVAMLAFISNIFKSGENTEIMAHLANSMIFFTCGLLLGALATGSTYLTQFSYHNGKNKTGTTFNIVSNVFVTVSYILFSYGVYIAYITLVG